MTVFQKRDHCLPGSDAPGLGQQLRGQVQVSIEEPFRFVGDKISNQERIFPQRSKLPLSHFFGKLRIFRTEHIRKIAKDVFLGAGEEFERDHIGNFRLLQELCRKLVSIIVDAYADGVDAPGAHSGGIDGNPSVQPFVSEHAHHVGARRIDEFPRFCAFQAVANDILRNLISSGARAAEQTLPGRHPVVQGVQMVGHGVNAGSVSVTHAVGKERAALRIHQPPAASVVYAVEPARGREALLLPTAVFGPIVRIAVVLLGPVQFFG